MTRPTPSEAEIERAAVMEWLKKGVGMELVRMRIACGLPGGTAHQRMKQRVMLDGMELALREILAGLAVRAHLTGEGEG